MAIGDTSGGVLKGSSVSSASAVSRILGFITLLPVGFLLWVMNIKRFRVWYIKLVTELSELCVLCGLFMKYTLTKFVVLTPYIYKHNL